MAGDVSPVAMFLIKDYISVFKFSMIFCTLLSWEAHILPRLSPANGCHIKQCIDHLNVIECQRTCHVNPVTAPKYVTSHCVLREMEELRKVIIVALYVYCIHHTEPIWCWEQWEQAFFSLAPNKVSIFPTQQISLFHFFVFLLLRSLPSTLSPNAR